ncbi:MAG: YdcF family protein [Planctomycetaceae bacterium]|nr:MAG: YdcF family protein [Planctomycetaceae bacterium]
MQKRFRTLFYRTIQSQPSDLGRPWSSGRSLANRQLESQVRKFTKRPAHRKAAHVSIEKTRLSAAVLAILAVAAVAAVPVLGTVYLSGISMGQRAMTDLIMPVSLFWLGSIALAVYWLRLGDRSAAGKWLLVSVVIWLSFSQPISKRLMKALEVPPLEVSPIDPEAKSYSAVVVLGGAAKLNRAGHPELGSSGERLGLAARMWHAGKVESIICTGSGARPLGLTEAEMLEPRPGDPSEVGRQLLIGMGVPDDRIFGSPGENTLGEMANLVRLFEQPPETLRLDEPVGLITSAFHIPRAMRLAETKGLDFDPIPADSSDEFEQFVAYDLIPVAGAGGGISRFIKEKLAALVGR